MRARPSGSLTSRGLSASASNAVKTAVFDADADGERQHRDEREQLAAPHHTAGIRGVTAQVLERRQAPTGSMLFPDSGHSAKPDQRGATCFLRAHAGAQVVLDVHLQMALELLVKVPIAVGGAKQTAKSADTTHQTPHGESPWRSVPLAEDTGGPGYAVNASSYGNTIAAYTVVLWEYNRCAGGHAIKLTGSGVTRPSNR